MDGLTSVLIHLSSEGAAIITNRQILSVLQEAVRSKALQVRMLVQSANNSIASSKLVSAYMPLLVSGNLQLCVIQSTPQTFTTTVNFVLPGQAGAHRDRDAAEKLAPGIDYGSRPRSCGWNAG